MAVLTAITKAARWDIEIQQGSTFTATLDFGDTPISAFGWRGQVRRTHQDADVLASYTFEVLPENQLKVSLAPTPSSQLPDGNLVHDIEAFTENDAWVMRVFEGRVRVSPEVTRG
jgi:hypothetical protein